MDWKGLRTFGQRPIGLAVLAVIGVLALTETLLTLGPYVAILVLLIFGLLVPIGLGQRRISRLMILGLVILVVTAPVFTALYVNELQIPSPAASSDPSSPYGHGGAVIRDAVVSPFTGAPGGSYTFSASIDPAYLPTNTSIRNVTFFVTDCPGATSNSSPNCPFAYALFTHTIPFAQPPTSRFQASFTQALPGVDVWWWNVEVIAESTLHPANTSGNLTGIWLFVGGSYVGVEGPVTGSFAQVYTFLLPSAYLDLFIYPGVVFLIGLLAYAFLKRREVARKGLTLGGSGTGSAVGGLGPPAAPGATAPSAPSPTTEELRCPSCQAVVYPNESTCWKCGKSLSPPVAATASPLPSSDAPRP